MNYRLRTYTTIIGVTCLLASYGCGRKPIRYEPQPIKVEEIAETQTCSTPTPTPPLDPLEELALIEKELLLEQAIGVW